MTLDSAFWQQKIGGWRPILAPGFVVGSLLVVGISFVVLGSYLLKSSEQVPINAMFVAVDLT